MIDSLLASQQKADESPVLRQLGLNDSGSTKPYALLTLHRPANVDRPETFREILEGLAELRQQMPVIFPAHPRTQKQIQESGLESYFATTTDADSRIRMIRPQGYLDFLCLMKNAQIVITDSGGIQEETTGLGLPCVTVRENTERPVTVEEGTNLLAGVSREGIRQAIARQRNPSKTKKPVPRYWDGKAAERIVEVLLQQVPARLAQA